jgi:hypothetical protein
MLTLIGDYEYYCGFGLMHPAYLRYCGPHLFSLKLMTKLVLLMDRINSYVIPRRMHALRGPSRQGVSSRSEENNGYRGGNTLWYEVGEGTCRVSPMLQNAETTLGWMFKKR